MKKRITLKSGDLTFLFDSVNRTLSIINEERKRVLLDIDRIVSITMRFFKGQPALQILTERSIDMYKRGLTENLNFVTVDVDSATDAIAILTQWSVIRDSQEKESS